MEKRNRHSVKRNAARHESEIAYPEEKHCARCGETKRASAFHKAKREKDGLKANCKTCAKQQRRDWYCRNQEKEKQNTAEWGKKNPDKVKQYRKATYKKNHASRLLRANAAYHAKKETILAECRDRYQKDSAFRAKKLEQCRESYLRRVFKVAEYNRKYRKENPEKLLAWSNAARSRKVNAPGECSSEEWQEILEYFNYCCAYCLRHTAEAGKLAVEHMIPLTRGGTNDPDNLVPACKSCNSSKSDRTILEFVGRLPMPRTHRRNAV